jgi:acyl-CoA reductase-like NAD-dependent aldehyde dehydrogenase
LCNDHSPNNSFSLSSSASTSAPLAVGGPENELSLLFTERNVDDIIPLVKKAKEAGAEILLVNVEKAGPTLLKPHILLGVKPETILWQRESFGPVPALTAVDTVDEVVELDSTLKINSC